MPLMAHVFSDGTEDGYAVLLLNSTKHDAHGILRVSTPDFDGDPIDLQGIGQPLDLNGALDSAALTIVRTVIQASCDHTPYQTKTGRFCIKCSAELYDDMEKN